jgi:hypothetical protein
MVSMRTYGGAPSLAKLGEAIKRQAAEKKIQAVLALAVAVDAGTVTLQDALEEAVTKTGLARELRAAGGFPGRHRTGEMVASISNNTADPYYDGERTIMALGWFADQFQAYFEEQDLGMDGIPAAHAMFHAQEEANAVMRSLMQQWAEGTLHFND